MFYDNELNFLVDVLKKTHIPVTKVSLSAPIHTIIDIDFEKILGHSISKDISIKEHNYIHDISKLIGLLKNDENSRICSFSLKSPIYYGSAKGHES